MNNKFLNQSLPRKIQERATRGRKVPAIVIEVFYDRATVRLASELGTVVRNLAVVGGPVVVDQAVTVDYSSDIPVVVAESPEGLSEDDVKSLLEEALENNVEATLQMSITLFSGGSIREIYPADETGLSNVLAEAVAGDVIYLPDVDISMNFTIPDGVSIVGVSSHQSIIRGTITMGEDTTLENLCVLNGIWGDAATYAIIAHSTGNAYIKNSEIHSYCCYSGTAYGVKLQTDTDLLHLQDCVIIADSSTGSAYGILGATGGVCKVIDCFIYGKTDQYIGNGIYVSGNTQGDSGDTQISRGCVALPTDIIRSIHGNGVAATPTNLFSYTGAISTPQITNFFTEDKASYSTTHYVVRQGDYLYFQNATGGNMYFVEYEISTTNTKTVEAPFPYQMEFAIAGDRLLVTNYDTSIYEVDFNPTTATITEVHSVDKDSWTELWDTNGISYYAGKVFGMKNIEGDILIIIHGLYREYYTSGSTGLCAGEYMIVKNYTQDSGWEENYALLDPNRVDHDQNVSTGASEAMVVRGEKFVSAYYGVFSNFDTPVSKFFYVATMDLITREFTITQAVNPFSTTDEGAIANASCINQNDGVVFFVVPNWNDVWSDQCVLMFDPYTLEITDYWLSVSTSSNYVMTSSRTKAYYAYQDGTTYYCHVLTRDGHTELWNTTTPPTRWYSWQTMVDEDGRAWTYTSAAPYYIYGTLIEDDTDTITIDISSISPPGNIERLMLVGDAAFVFVVAGSSTDDEYYYITE